ncbi:unnamed protein product [Symbiodinium microadriaticum]|nr:unnamed protein product [Symbiodinium microadriaticum]CAE7946221.1 unnamed protein product [Symbiodinium sp. KB8]
MRDWFIHVGSELLDNDQNQILPLAHGEVITAHWETLHQLPTQDIASAVELPFDMHNRDAEAHPLTGNQALAFEDDGDEDASSELSSSEDHDVRHYIQFLVLIPDYSAHEVTVSLPPAVGVDEALNEISLQLPDDIYRLHSVVLPLHPQPGLSWGAVLALPNWATAEMIGALDMTLVDGRFFATVLPHTATRADLCSLGDLDDTDDFDIWIGNQCLLYGNVQDFPMQVQIEGAALEGDQLQVIAGHWPFATSEDDDSSVSLSDSADSVVSQNMQWICFVVIVPGYVSEYLTVLLALPATLEEAIEAVDEARSIHQQILFPHLLPASPQPCARNGILVASPHWQSHSMTICIDTTELDGRLFSVSAPEYANRDTILRLSAIPLFEEVEIFVGPTFEPLAAGIQVHLFPAVTVKICLPGSSVPPTFSLASMLSVRREWSADPELPPLSSTNRLCVVSEDDVHICHFDSGSPMSYKAQSARSAGLPHDCFGISPAQPRVQDLSLHGHPCRTALGVSLTRRPVCLIDCRPLLLGWMALPIADGLIDVRALLAELDDATPLFWSPLLQDIPNSSRHVRADQGEVFVARLALAPQARPSLSRELIPENQDALPSPSHEEIVSSPPMHDQVAYVQHCAEICMLFLHLASLCAFLQACLTVSSVWAWSLSNVGGTDSIPNTISSSPLESAHGGTTSAAQDPPTESGQHAAESVRPIVAMERDRSATMVWHFILLTPNMEKEFVNVTLPVHASVPEALAAVAAARSFIRTNLFEHIIPVDPQPARDFGTLIAVPRWASDVCAICMNLHHLDGRIFTMVLPYRLNRESLLLHAGLDSASDCDVFVGDSWVPLIPGQVTRLWLGLTISFVAHRQVFNPEPSLRGLLARSDSSHEHPDLPVSSHGRNVWVLTDGMPRLFDASNTDRDSFRRHIAAYVSISIDRLSLQPPLPMLQDFDHQGRLCIRTVVATGQVSRVPVPPGRLLPPRCIYILDRRPILQGVTWGFAEHNQIAVEPLVQVLSADAPARHHAVVVGGTLEHRWDRSFIHVHPGQVLLVHFVPDDSESGAEDDAPPPWDTWPDWPDPEADQDGDEDTSDTYGGYGDGGTGSTEQAPSHPRGVDTPQIHTVSGIGPSLRSNNARPAMPTTSARVRGSFGRPPGIFGLSKVVGPWLQLFILFLAAPQIRAVQIHLPTPTVKVQLQAWDSQHAVLKDRRQLGAARDDFHYVPGHQGHFFNEAADALAKHGARVNVTAPCLSITEEALGFWLGRGALHLPWAALTLWRLLGDSTMPSLCSKDLGDDRFHAGMSHADLLCPFVPNGALAGPDVVTPPDQQFSMDLRLLSFNTLSLGACVEDDAGRGTGETGLHQRPARAALLASQLQELSISVAALQETRCPQGFTRIGGFLRFASGANRGQHGTELWFRDGGQVLFTRAHERELIKEWWEVGPTATYTQKRNGRTCRPDFIAIPSSWGDAVVHTWVEHGVHVASAGIDHFATSASVQQFFAMPGKKSSQARPRIPAQIFTDPNFKEDISKALREAMPWSGGWADQVKDATGEVCADPVAVQQRWREYFAAMEAGTCMPAHELATELLNAESGQWPVPDCTHQLPCRPDLVRLMLTSKAGKAAGMDGLPNELLRSFAPECAEVLFPLLMKLVFRGTEAIGMKGGLAVWFHKGKGAKDACESYRQILLLPCFAKILHQAVRPAIREVFQTTTPTLQLGGKPGQNVCFGAHLVRAFLRYNSRLKRSCFVLFTDIATAFYAVVRQLIAVNPSDPPQARELSDGICQGLQLSPDDIAQLKLHAQEPSSLRQAGASPWLEAISDSIAANTWFMLRGDSTAVLTARGTRPGSSWADILFGMVVSRVLKARDAIEGADVSTRLEKPSVPWDGQKVLIPCPNTAGTLELGDLVWADDVATMRVCRSPYNLAPGLAVSAGSLCDSCAGFGFRLSFGPNKTASIVQPGGAGSRKAAQTLFGPNGHKGSIKALREHAQPISVPLVSCYRHLGVMQAPRGALVSEIKFRTAQAWAKFAEGRRKVFKATGVSVKRKAFILRSSVLPKLLYGSGSWPTLSLREQQAFGGALWGLYRAICGIPAVDAQNVHSCSVLALTGLPNVAVTLHCQRLLYLKTLVQSGPDDLWAAVRTDIAFLDAVVHALDWLFTWTHATSSLPALCNLAEGDDSIVWEIVSDYVEPLQVLRETVRYWQSQHAGETWVQEAAENVLLLLDPEMIGEPDSAQYSKVNRHAFAKGLPPAWPDLPQFCVLPFPVGQRVNLEAPPPVILSPHSATSVRLRLGQAYGDWLEQACALLARSIVNAQTGEQGLYVSCEGLEASLGPASKWLRAAGFAFEPGGMRSCNFVSPEFTC